MKTIKVKFVDMWNDYELNDSFLYKAMLHSGYPIELSEDPDYLVCSVFGHEALNEKYDDCIKIIRTSECRCPDFSLYDYAIGMEYLDFGDRYLRYPSLFRDFPADATAIKETLSKGENIKADIAEKTDFCSFVYSNGTHADPIRKTFFKELCQYKKVNSGGRFLNNIGQPNGVDDKLAFQRRHKFVIAYENASHPGYTTEKILDAFAAHSVPIYWGDPCVKKIFNEKAFICAHDFPDTKALIEWIKEVDNNDSLYAQMLKEPATLHPEEITLEYWQEQLDSFMKAILDQPKESAFRRSRYANSLFYLQEMRQAFLSTPQQILGKKMIQTVKKLIPIRIKQKIRDYIVMKK